MITTTYKQVTYSVVDVQQDTIDQRGSKVASKNDVKDFVKGKFDTVEFESICKSFHFLVSKVVDKNEANHVHQSSQIVQNNGVTEFSILCQHRFVSVSFE